MAPYDPPYNTPHDTQAWTRRAWLTRNAAVLAAGVPLRRAWASSWHVRPTSLDAATAARVATHAVRIEPGPLEALVQRAIDAARTAGARYADARLTRTVGHVYSWNQGARRFAAETEVQGVGVRALVEGYWGFAAASSWDAETVVRLAQAAVAQARVNAKVSAMGGAQRRASGPPRTVDLASAPVATGMWTTPIVIDPFTVPVEEKLDHILAWEALAQEKGVHFPDPFRSSLTFVRQECVLATSDGTLVTQTTYETGGDVVVDGDQTIYGNSPPSLPVQGLGTAGRGWELILDAKIPEQLAAMPALMVEQLKRGAKPSQVGRYTLVCDGATMAALLANTLGAATQLDRALGYEANATGTSFLTDPLGMVGQYQVAAPLVTVTANRSVPTQLATVGWDAEGVVPQPFTLIKAGVVADFQTTREQATWLAPYYAKGGHPVQSHGCAAAEDALVTPLQMLPNLALAPGAASARLEDLVADVKEGILITNGGAATDFQGRTGLLEGEMREIKNGRLVRGLSGGAVLFDSLDLWKKITALGGPATTAVVGHGSDAFIYGGHGAAKGEPAQGTSYSVQAVAAIIPNQPLIDPARKA